MELKYNEQQNEKSRIAKSAELTEEAAKKSGKDVGLIYTILDAFFCAIEDRLLTHDQIELHEDFGSLVMRDAGGQSQKHPQKKPTPKHRVISFKAASTLKKRLRK